ncbi:MAG: hypothetical protein WBM48_00890 [Polyangiales bacterium]|jgi:hypothetical protein
MPWQEIMAGLIVVAAGAYVVWRLRRRKGKPQGPDVPLARLSQKRRKRDSCGH